MKQKIKTSWHRLINLLKLDKRDVFQVFYYAIFAGLLALTFADIGLGMAGATLAFIPMFIIFMVFQRAFIKGITVGSLKG